MGELTLGGRAYPRLESTAVGCTYYECPFLRLQKVFIVTPEESDIRNISIRRQMTLGGRADPMCEALPSDANVTYVHV